jgi:hypothetical protein
MDIGVVVVAVVAVWGAVTIRVDIGDTAAAAAGGSLQGVIRAEVVAVCNAIAISVGIRITTAALTGSCLIGVSRTPI